MKMLFLINGQDFYKWDIACFEKEGRPEREANFEKTAREQLLA